MTLTQRYSLKSVALADVNQSVTFAFSINIAKPKTIGIKRNCCYSSFDRCFKSRIFGNSVSYILILIRSGYSLGQPIQLSVLATISVGRPKCSDIETNLSA